MVAQVMLLLFDMLDQKGEPSLHVVYQAIIQSKIIYALPDALRESAGSAIPTSSIPVHPPTIEEVDKAISRLRSRRAPGICGITSELLKTGGICCSEWLTNVICKAWESGSAPDDWKRGIILPFYKGKNKGQTVRTTEASHYFLYQAKFMPTCC